ncbi:MAG: type II toxin-antitoxin system RelE/ParE family toxin [Cypionkella sp.]
MSRVLQLTPLSQGDLTAIWNYGVQIWSIAQAETYLHGMQRVFDLLCAQPDIARLRAEFNPAIRLYSYQSHIIIYVADDTVLQVIRVLHMRANWADVLNS